MNSNDEIVKVGLIGLEKRRWNHPTLIPLTEDLQKLQKLLLEVQEASTKKLRNNHTDLTTWRNLATSTLASIIMFNRRREGEVSQLRISVLNQANCEQPQDDILASLSAFELQLCKTLKSLEIRGKRGRKVPLILTRKNEEAMELLVKTRYAVGVSENNEYVFSIPTMRSENFIRGNDAIRKHVQEISDLTCPEAITSTRLRKHIATITQLQSLEKRELEMLATFLGHNISVHREYYRLPENTLQLAKCGKLLVMMDEGRVAENAGRYLSEIEVQKNGMHHLIFRNYFKGRNFCVFAILRQNCESKILRKMLNIFIRER